MNIALLIKDDRLKECFVREKSNPEWELVFLDGPESVSESGMMSRWDALVLSDRCFDFSGLADAVERLLDSGKIGKIAVLLSNRHLVEENEKYLKFCLYHDLIHTHPGQSVEAIVRHVYRSISGEASAQAKAKRNKTAVFMGSTPNIGTTLAAFGTAAQMAMRTDRTIAYLCLNLKSSKIHRYLGVDRPPVTLDEIRPELKSMSLDRQRLKRCCEKIKGFDNLYVLFGNMLREQAEFYTPDDMDYLLQLASETFDVCIVEVSAYWDNAATACAGLFADTRVVVTSAQLACFQEDIARWLQTIAPMFGLHASGFDLFVTRQPDAGSFRGFHPKDIRRETGMNVIGGMRADPRADPMLDQGQIVELVTGKTAAARDLGRMAHTLIALYRLDGTDIPVKKAAAGNMFSGSGGARILNLFGRG